MIEALKSQFIEILRHGLDLAAQAFLKYLRVRGVKTSPLPEFFIGGHAQASGLPILTRDTARYDAYFPDVELICPAKGSGAA